MKILVVGSGGREHALVWRLAQDGHVLLAAPGNPGIAAIAACHPVGVGELDALTVLAIREAVDLVVVGPEAPLCAGLADRLRGAGIPTFGPGASGARLEGSKVFAKELFARHGIPTAPFAACTTQAEADAAIDRLGGAVVVKADGLAAGKGVVVAGSAEEARGAAAMMLATRPGEPVLIEGKLRGREVSILALTDGARLEVLAPAEDHKTIFDGDRGPNTGGMGTVSPAWVTDAIVQRIVTEVLEPTVRGLAAEGVDYRGVLYAGVMVGDDGTPWTLEYNCRFGDPETQPVLARVRGDLGAVLLGAARGEMPVGGLTWDPRTAVCVVLAAPGYPEAPRTGEPITLPPPSSSDADDVLVFHAGTARRDGALVTAGGRVLGVTALGDGVDDARRKAYATADAIDFAGKQLRRDIGQRR